MTKTGKLDSPRRICGQECLSFAVVEARCDNFRSTLLFFPLPLTIVIDEFFVVVVVAFRCLALEHNYANNEKHLVAVKPANQRKEKTLFC